MGDQNGGDLGPRLKMLYTPFIKWCQLSYPLDPINHNIMVILLQAGLRLVSSPLERRKLTMVSKSQKISWMKRYVNTCIQCSMEWV